MSVFDLGGSVARGVQTGMGVMQARRQNALADFYKTQGADLIAGKPNALAGYAALDPQGALSIQNTLADNRRADASLAMQQEAHGLNMQMTRERIAEIRRQSAEAAKAEAARLDAAALEQERQQLSGVVAGARQAIIQGPEAWEQFKATIPADMWQQSGLDPAALTFEVAPAALAMVVGMLEGVEEARQFAAGMNGSGGDPTAEMRNLQWRAEQAGLQPGTPEYADFMRSGGRVEASRVIMGPDGQPLLMEGPAASNFKFTEGQSKDNVYATRARGSLDVLEPVADALTGRGAIAAEMVPFGLARGLQSDDFQVAQQAGTEFLQAILRKDTGAAITQDETESYGRVYLPQPGDGEAVLEAKRQARIRAINALESGMSPQQMLVRDRALIKAAEESGTPQPAPQSGGIPDFRSMSDEELDAFIRERGGQ